MPTHSPTPKPSATMIMSPTAPLNTNTTTAPTPTQTAKPTPAQAAQKEASNLTKVKLLSDPTRPLNECEGDCDKVYQLLKTLYQKQETNLSQLAEVSGKVSNPN